MSLPILHFGSGVLRPDIEEGLLFLDIVKNGVTYTIPYIQSSPELDPPPSSPASRPVSTAPRLASSMRRATLPSSARGAG
jgi:hypothetical protein